MRRWARLGSNERPLACEPRGAGSARAVGVSLGGHVFGRDVSGCHGIPAGTGSESSVLPNRDAGPDPTAGSGFRALASEVLEGDVLWLGAAAAAPVECSRSP